MDQNSKPPPVSPSSYPRGSQAGFISAHPRREFAFYSSAFAILAVVVAGLIWYDLQQAYRDTIAYWEVRMSASAAERLSFANLWLNERRTDTQAIADGRLSARLLAGAANHEAPDSSRRSEVAAIEKMARINGFAGGAIADTECRIVAQAGLPLEAVSGATDVCRRTQEVKDFSVLIYGAHRGHVWLYLACPVFAGPLPPRHGPAGIVGAVVMIAEPWKPVFPFLALERESKYPTDTLIVWEDADQTVVFSPALAIQGAESQFRRLLNRPTLESRAAREGTVPFGEFTDYRGVQVLGTARPIGSTGASLIRKVGRAQALSDFHKRVGLESLAGTLALLFLGAVIAAIHRHATAQGLKDKIRQQEILLDFQRREETSEERFRELVESVDAIVWEADAPTLRVSFVSKGVETILGYTADQWLSIPDFWSDHLHPKDRERALATERQVQEKGASQMVEYRMAAADGRFLWFRDYMHAKPGPDGKAAQLRGIMVDITHSKRTAESLRESEERFRTTIENAGIGIAILDLNGRPILCNSALQKMLGYSQEELSRMVFTSFTHPDDRERDWQLYREILEGKRGDYQVEKRYIRKNGQFIWGRVTVSLVKDYHGQPKYAVGMAEDITERKRKEDEIARLKHAIDAHYDGAFWMDNQDRFIYVNAAAFQTLGYTREELLAMSLSDINPRATPRRANEVWEILRSKGFYSIETVHRRKDGSEFPVEVVTTHLQFQGAEYACGFARDISERKRAEEELRASRHLLQTTLYSLRDAVFILSIEGGQIIECNPAATRMFGYPRDEILGRTSRFLHVNEPALHEFRARLSKAMAEKGDMQHLEFSMRRQDGTIFPTCHSVAPLRDSKGKQTGWVSLVQDITERKQAEEDLQRTLSQLRALAGHLQGVREEERRRLAREIHDQLGQALTAIRLEFCSLLNDLPDGGQASSNKASSITNLVDETIQTVRRICTELRPGMLDDLGLVATVEWAGEDFQTRTGTKCRMDLPEEDIVIDSERATAIFRILQETLTNVARHAAASRVTVRLGMENGELTLEVRDNGRGFDRTRLSIGESLGILGMQERALLLGGELSISSVPEEGTTVRVRFPHGPPHEKGGTP